MAAVITQPHEAPVRRETPHHRKPERKAPATPERAGKPATRAKRDPHERRQKRETGKDRAARKRAQKSAPVDERTLPIGSGARIGIPSLGALPTTIRRH